MIDIPKLRELLARVEALERGHYHMITGGEPTGTEIPMSPRRDVEAMAKPAQPDADDAAVDAISEAGCQEWEARSILAAIRAGKVPGIYAGNEAIAIAGDLTKQTAEITRLKAELAAAKEGAEKAEYERDVANDFIGHWSQECATARAERDAARAGLAELRLEVWDQWALDMGDGWQSDGALSTLEDIADELVEGGALERHPERPWYRRVVRFRTFYRRNDPCLPPL